MLKPQSGKISVCCYCGEQVGNTQKYCVTCKTQNGRKSIFDQNAEILKENKKLGFKVPETMKSWK